MGLTEGRVKDFVLGKIVGVAIKFDIETALGVSVGKAESILIGCILETNVGTVEAIAVGLIFGMTPGTIVGAILVTSKGKFESSDDDIPVGVFDDPLKFIDGKLNGDEFSDLLGVIVGFELGT